MLCHSCELYIFLYEKENYLDEKISIHAQIRIDILKKDKMIQSFVYHRGFFFIDYSRSFCKRLVSSS